jgi:PAS domain S-box-containing protein
LGELDDKPWSTFTHPDDVAENNALSDKLLRGEITSFRMEKRYIHKNGGIVRAHLTVSLVGDDVKHARFRVVMIEDITERKKAEEALGESEQNLSGIMANIDDSVVTMGEAGAILSFNKAAERTFGHRAEEVIGGTVEQLMPGSVPGRHQGFVDGYLESGRSAVIGKGPRELEGRRKDGSTFPLEITVSEMHIGERRTFIGAIRDITERKQAEDALRLAQFSLDHAGVAVFWVGESGRLEYINKSCQRMLGYSRDELSELHIWKLDPYVAEAEWPRIWARIAHRASHTFESIYLAKDGGEVPVEVTTTQVSLGDHQFVCSFSRDITERKRAEAALRASEAHLNQAQRIAHIGSWEYDVQTKEISWSDEIYRIYGVRRGEFIPTIESILELIHPDDRDGIAGARGRAPYDDRPYDQEFRILRPDGELRRLHSRAFSMNTES